MNAHQKHKLTLSADLHSYQESVKGRTLLGYYCMFPGFRFTYWLRLHSWLAELSSFIPLTAITARILRHQSLKTGIQIDPATSIGKGLYMPHFGGIVVNPGATIGNDCYLSHNVTIGKVHSGIRKGIPKIGNNVFIGTGSVILGNITIGNNAAIAANSVVIDDVPAGVFVAGNPAKIIAEKTSDDVLGRTARAQPE